MGVKKLKAPQETEEPFFLFSPHSKPFSMF